MTVRYTPGQLRDAVAMPPETYRHWKKVLAPLRRNNTRQSPCFTAGGLVGRRRGPYLDRFFASCWFDLRDR